MGLILKVKSGKYLKSPLRWGQSNIKTGYMSSSSYRIAIVDIYRAPIMDMSYVETVSILYMQEIYLD